MPWECGKTHWISLNDWKKITRFLRLKDPNWPSTSISSSFSDFALSSKSKNSFTSASNETSARGLYAVGSYSSPRNWSLEARHHVSLLFDSKVFLVHLFQKLAAFPARKMTKSTRLAYTATSWKSWSKTCDRNSTIKWADSSACKTSDVFAQFKLLVGLWEARFHQERIRLRRSCDVTPEHHQRHADRVSDRFSHPWEEFFRVVWVKG